MEQQTSSESGKEYVKAVYCHPVYLTYMQSTSCEMQETLVRSMVWEDPLEKGKAPHSSNLAWRNQWTV